MLVSFSSIPVIGLWLTSFKLCFRKPSKMDGVEGSYSLTLFESSTP